MDKNCYFCDSTNVEPFALYYTNCLNCSAIYARMIVWDATCTHINSKSPSVLRKPYYKMLKEYPAIVKLEDSSQVCSVCNKICIAGG